MALERPRPDSLRLEIEELTALVSQVGDEAEQEPEDSERQCRQRRGDQDDEGSARERIAAQFAEDPLAGNDLERAEGRSAKLRSEPAGRPVPVEPEFVRHGRPGNVGVEGSRNRAPVRGNDVVVDGREAADGADDPHEERLPGELERENAARPGGSREAGRDHDRYGTAVGRLLHALPRVELRADDVAETVSPER